MKRDERKLTIVIYYRNKTTEERVLVSEDAYLDAYLEELRKNNTIERVAEISRESV